MKHKLLFTLTLIPLLNLYSQVGINNTNPQGTLHISPTKTDGTTAEGIIAPNLTRAQLISKDTQYTATQRGAMVYVTTLNGTVSTKTAKITTIGYYYFDGSVWQHFSNGATIPSEPWRVQGNTTQATTNTQNIYQMGSIGIGASTTVPAAYKLQVTGASYVSVNSRVGSSTIVGAQTIGTTLGVTGATTLSSTLTVAGTSTLKGATTIGTTAANANLTVNGNTGLGIATPTQKLDVRGNEFVSGVSKIGGSTTLNASAQLELADANKGFLPNRVALTSSTVKAPVAGAVDGMMVYNTASVAAQGLTPGYYYWRTDKWNRPVDEISETTINVRDLRVNATSLANDANNTDKGAILNFNTAFGKPIVIPEDGAYAFSFRLYGPSAKQETSPGRLSYYYIALMVGTKIIDTAEMDITHGLNSPVLTYSITLGGSFEKGEVVTIRLSHHSSSSAWTLKSRPDTTGADRTSMVWWKL